MASTSARRNTTKRARAAAAQVSERILETFSNKAKRIGLRALTMTELASELHMSAATLYRLYPSKEALALACVDRWADELGAADAAQRDRRERVNSKAVPRDGFERYMVWIEAWADANAALSPAFARDLKSDYPAVWQRYREIVEDRKRRGALLLRPLLKPSVDERVAFAVLNTIFMTVLEPDFADRLHVSRREAIRSAVSIWAGGALNRQANLRSLRGGKRTKR
jgi:AcrR family transcriptional regulator